MNIFIMLSLVFSTAYAKTCSTSYTPAELFNKALEKEILFETKEKDIAAMDGYITDALRIYNPDFEHFTTAGDQYGSQNVTSESRIWFNLQTGGKREKKADVVRTEKEISQAQLQVMKLKLRKELLLGMLRYKQIYKEINSVVNLRETIGGFIDRYDRISFLSPEQKVEKGSLDMSENDLTLREAALVNEKELILRFFQRALREECVIEIALETPVKENSWPMMKDIKFKSDASLAFKVAQLGIKKSEFELVRENSKKYPDLKIGPVWQLNRLGNQEFNIFGAAIIVPLPIFDRNQGLRQATQFHVERAKLEADFTRQQVSKEFSFRRKNYIRLKNNYKRVSELDKYDTLLKEYRGLFKRGLISIPNFLTYKREMLNFTNELHKIETSLADHLVEIYYINNEGTDHIIPKVLHL